MAEDKLQRLLLRAFDYYAQRSLDRLDGLTDDEYFWEPVDGCWSLRQTAEGWQADWQWPAPESAPVTTIAWRTVHVIDCLQHHGLRKVAFEGGTADWQPPVVLPPTADEAREALAAAADVWRKDLQSVDDEALWRPLGPEAGPYAEDPVAGFVEHIHDELIHHCAEIALLRDLYAHRPQG